MKRFLLFAIMCVCVSVGTWAIPDGAVSFGESSYYLANSDGSYTIYLGKNGDLKSKEGDWSWGQTVPWKSADKLIIEAAPDLSFSTMSSSNEFYILLQNVDAGKTVDFSAISASQADDLASNLGSSSGSNNVKSIIVPDSYSNDVASFVSKVGYSFTSTNYYGIGEGTVSAYIQSDGNSDLAGIVDGVEGTVTNVNISGTAAGDNVINDINNLANLTNASITGKMHAGLTITIDNDNITSLDFSGVKPADNNTLKIDVSGCAGLTDINLTDATVAEVNVGESFHGTIHVTDPENLGFTLIPETASEYVEGPVLPPYSLSSSNLELINNNTANNSIGDQIYWKVNSTATENSVVTINVSEPGGLSEILTTLANDGYTNRFTKMVITGALNASDMEAIGRINAEALDMSGATLVESRNDGKSILSEVSNNNVKYLVLPEGMTRDDVKDSEGNVTKIGTVNASTLSGFTALYSAVSLERKPGATSTAHELYSLTSYVKTPGSLQAAVMLLDNWGYDGSKNIAENNPLSHVMVTGRNMTQYLKDIVVSGTINAFDITGETTLNQGHVEYEPNKGPSEPIHGAAQHGVVTGYATAGPFLGAVLTSIDLRDAEFYDFDTYKADFTIAKLGIMDQTNTHKLVIPEAESVNEIPGDFLYVANGSMNGLKEICIPSNIEYIRAYAFTGSLDHIWTTAGNASYEDEYTKYDNGAVTRGVKKVDDQGQPVTDENGNPVMETQDAIHYGYKDGYAAYDYGTYTFSSNLKLIESHAFANSTAHVKDVYVLALEAPECHVDAFTTVMYFGDNGYDPSVIDEQGIVTRDAYYKGDNKWICMLHYPKEVQAPNLQRYTDPTRDYSIATGEKDGNGATIYFPNHSEFGYAYGQATTGYVWDGWKVVRTGSANAIEFGQAIGTNGWQVSDQSAANALYNANDNTEKTLKTFYDVTDGNNSDVTAPTPAPVTIHDLYWSEKDYQLADNQVDDSYVRLYDADYRGWHQFVLNGYSANTTRIVEFERSYITDSDWWTICLPYDLTRSEMIRFFGDKDSNKIPYLSRLLYVTRDVKNTHITLNFSKNLMEHKEIMANEGDIHGQLDNGIDNDHSYGIVKVSETEAPADDDVVLHAGVPYVIKPYIPSKTDANKNNENVSRKFAFYLDNPEDEAMYYKLKAAREMNGRALIDLVENGLYTVPALIMNNTDDNMKEADNGKKIKIGNKEYPVSSKFTYTMVGSFFKNLLPVHCYYLGWKWTDKANNIGKACFWYNTNSTQKKWAWVNHTAIICPNWDASTEVHEATGTADPARWIVGGESNTLGSDDFVATAAGSKRALDIVIELEDDEDDGVVTGVKEISTPEVEETEVHVYSINGTYVGNSLRGLAKGVYVVNGKKVVLQ